MKRACCFVLFTALLVGTGVAESGKGKDSRSAARQELSSPPVASADVRIYPVTTSIEFQGDFK
jgi:hypothetical protein